MVGIAKQILRSAVKARLLTQNPFAEEKTTPPEKAEHKQYHVSAAEVQTIYKACPTTEWQAFLILGRYAGLRLPSEMQPLKWEHVNWKASIFTVHSSKLEHLRNGGVRQIPLFPQVRAVLKKLWAENPEEYVLPHLRTIQNPNPLLRRIIEDAGVTPWPDLLYNLRQSAINDAEHDPRFTAKNISDWFGNSEKTRKKHYSRTLAEDVRAAAEGVGTDLAWMDNTDSVQILSTNTNEPTKNGHQSKEKTPELSGVFAGIPSGSQDDNGPNWTRTSDLHDVNVAL
jgi:integrase